MNKLRSACSTRPRSWVHVSLFFFLGFRDGGLEICLGVISPYDGESMYNKMDNAMEPRVWVWGVLSVLVHCWTLGLGMD